MSPHLGLLGLELLLFLACVLGLARRPGRRLAILAGLCLVAFAATAVVTWTAEASRWQESRESLAEDLPVRGAEPGFVTSDTCRSCHPGEYASWHRTYHRTMTQPATPETVRGEFNGVRLVSRGREYHLERRGDEFWVEMIDPDWERLNRLQGADVDAVADPPRVLRRVVMVTGSHHMQTYWVGSVFGNELLNLPFVYLFEDQRWIPREDAFLRPPEAPPFLDLWNDNCLECHTTLGIPGLEPEAEAFATRTAELGIACESCHGPAQEHVRAKRNPLTRYRQHWSQGADDTVVQPARLEPRRASQVCGQCHGVALSDARDWLANGHSYRAGDELEDSRFLVLPAENGQHPRIQNLLAQQPMALDARFWSDGQVRVSGRDYTGMIESPCYERGELSCLSCHSMHDSSPADQLAAGMDGNQACLQCHGEFAENLERHTHHPAASAASQCYNCHMPHTTYGLLSAIRSHTISSPSVAESVSTGRPNACNLCHLDRTLEWTGEHLGAWYGEAPVPLSPDEQEISAALLWLLRGDAGQRALVAWSFGWQPALEASGSEWTAPYLGHLLNDPYAAVRYIAWRSLRQQPPYAGLGYDFIAPPAERAAARGRVIEQWLQRPIPPHPLGEPVLIAPDGNLRVDTLARLSAQRDDRPIALGE